MNDVQKPATHNTESQKLLNYIVDYWNNEGLCSFDSSTSHKNKHLASFENYIESRLLSDILNDYLNQNVSEQIGMDIGAGLGRFTVILARYLDHVYAIEPAPQLYAKLKGRCESFNNVSAINTTLESYKFSSGINFAIISGVLYLYDDEMIDAFMDDLNITLKGGSYVIIRDFIVTDAGKKVKSSYVKDAFCYYRNPNYWQVVANKWDMELIEIFKTTPVCNRFIRRMFEYPILGEILSRVYDCSWFKDRSYLKMKDAREKSTLFLEDEINTVFIVLMKKSNTR